MTGKTHADEFFELVDALQALKDAGGKVSLAALNKKFILSGTPLSDQYRVRNALSSGNLLGE